MPKNLFHSSMFVSNKAFNSPSSISSFFSMQAQPSMRIPSFMQGFPSMHMQSSPHTPPMQSLPHLSPLHWQPFTPLPSIMQGQVSSMVMGFSIPVVSARPLSTQQAVAAVREVTMHSASKSATKVFFIENILRFFSVIISPRRFRRLDSHFRSASPRAPARIGS